MERLLETVSETVLLGLRDTVPPLSVWVSVRVAELVSVHVAPLTESDSEVVRVADLLPVGGCVAVAEVVLLIVTLSLRLLVWVLD